MSKLHIIGVGGTGHKVLSAAVHLAACGAFKGNLGPNQINEIRVLTIDADDANGNLTQTKNVISAYRKFYDALGGTGGTGALGLVGIEPVTEKLNVPLYHEGKKSVSRTFNIPQYAGSDDDAFIRFLYSNDEIEAEFDQGFYGHTSIGTLIVKDILKGSDVWKEQISLINENDFVVIVGSIFGGTGASAIPVLIDELSAYKKETAFKFAALLLNPYFKTAGEIKESGLLKPDSANFNIKAKAALYYYYRQEQFKKTDALYVIGESEPNFSIELASIGSANQRNKAHPVELFAASALVDFVSESNDREDGGIITACRAEQDGQFCYTWKMLHDIEPHLPANIQNTIKAAIFYNKVLYADFKHGLGSSASTLSAMYDTDLSTTRDSKQNLVYENIHNYLRMLVAWFYDIHKHNKTEVNKSTGELLWAADDRVKLFNARHENLFDDVPTEADIIENFIDLVYRDDNGKKSEKINVDLVGKKPAAGADKGFPGLFASLLHCCASEVKKGLFSKKAPEPEKFETIPYLSRENDVTLGIPLAPGKLWTKSQPKLLMDIAEGLPSSFSDSFTKNELSIPSPWSIYIMNELTLTEDKFLSIHKTAFKEWCGIIALLVLRKICHYENAGLQLAPLALGGGDGDFLRVVQSTLTPGSFVFDNQNWTQCHRVSLDGVTLAFLANNTLVCPAYTIDTVTRAKLHKIAPSIVGEHGDFLTPDNYYKDQSQKMNRDARYALKLFLDDLYTILTREAAHNKNAVIKSLQTLTDKYRGALTDVQKNIDISIEPEHKNAVHSPAALFEQLCIAPNAANIELPFLMEGSKASAALIGLTICGISSSSADAAHHLVTPSLVYNQITAANIGSYNNTAPDGIRLLYADDLLCDGMVMIKKEGGAVFHAMPNAGSHKDYEIIWPVSETLLELYSPAALNSMLSLVCNAETVTVSLKIKLKGKLGSHTVTKEYRIKNRGDMNETDTGLHGICCIMDKNLIPFWSAWPYAHIYDTQGNNTWQRYTCFCVEPQYRGMPVLDIKPVFNKEGSFLVKENSLSTLKTVIQEYFYRRYTRLPSAFSVNEKTEGAPIYRGLVFMAEPKQVQAEASTWNVGVDFGTTSTTAFYTSSGGGAPTFIQLMDEYQWIEGHDNPELTKYANDVVTLCDNSDDSKKWYFLDKQCFKQNGYATALEVMDNKGAAAGAVLFDTHRIFWHNYKNFRILNTQEGRKERLLTNIKWDKAKSNSAKYLNQLLTQIVYHAALKGARTLNFFFSYPTAFGPDARNQFCGRLKDIVKLLADETGFTLNFNEKNNLLTESIAAAYYFDWKQPKQKLFFCVDIGGGSTDASIWVERKNIFQTSIHFASRDMFIKALRRLIEIKTVLKAVTTDKNSDGIYMMLSDVTSGTDLTGDKFKFFIETVLFEYYKPLRNRLDNLEGQDKTAFECFKYCVYIAYSGLMYYLINTVAALFVNKEIDNDIPEMVLGLSGKGSKMTDWIASGIIYEEAEHYLKEKTGLDIKINPLFKSETAKTETAIEMICNLDAGGKQKNQSALIEPCMYMGCAITAGGNGEEDRTIKEGEFIDTYNDTFFTEPASLTITFDKELQELGAFISFFNKIAAKSGGDLQQLNADFFEKSKKSLWSKIDKESKNALKEGRFEPPFILVLKVFLEEYAEECLWKKLN